MESGVVKAAISDHYVVYVVRKYQGGIKYNHKHIHTRQLENFNKEAFSADFDAVNWSAILVCSDDINVILDKVMRTLSLVIEKHAPSIERRVSEKYSPWLSPDLKALFRTRDRIKNATVRGKLEILMDAYNETMIWNWNTEEEGYYPKSIISINKIPLNNTRTFKYLGVWNTANDIPIGKTELDYRINSAKCAFAEHRGMLTNKNITLRTRITFLNGFVRSRLTYGCHAWRPTQAELSKLNATYNKFRRGMIWNGFKRKQEHCNYNDENTTEIDWPYKISNEKLYKITNTVNITNNHLL